MKKKAFFFIFKGLSLKQIKRFFLEGESLVLNKVLSLIRFTQINISKKSLTANSFGSELRSAIKLSCFEKIIV